MRSSHGDGSETIRRARPDDIEPILTLLTEYELPRSSFEPFYMHDTSYRPEHSWVVEQQGRLLSHIRIYDRWIRVGQAKLHIASIGNVITARDARTLFRLTMRVPPHIGNQCRRWLGGCGAWVSGPRWRPPWHSAA